MNQVVTLAEPLKTAQERELQRDVRALQAEPAKIVHIYLVDDNNEFLLAAKRLLSSNPLFRIVGWANSGCSALEQIRHLKPDLVIMDLVMPVMDGIQAIRLLKSQDSDTRVVLISLGEGPEYHRSAEEAGAEGYLAKSEFGNDIIPFIERLFGVVR
jgi:two-component system, NarL family, nitrate/nitrite response regulator NarL